MKINKLIVPFICLLLLISYKSYSQGTGVSPLLLNSEQPIYCEGTDYDGSQFLRVIGKGKNLKEAQRDANKKAVNATIFTGIRDGKEGCSVKPLLNTANAREKYSTYFNRFFSNHGLYKKFVKTDHVVNKPPKKISSKGKNKIYSMIVVVNSPKLLGELRQKGIVPR